jgi:hypothetical protein
MKAVAIMVCAAVVVALIALFANAHIAPLFFNSRLERLHENGLPKIVVEGGGTIYCRMKADDFRFRLPPGSRATNAVVTGGFDTVDGSVEARFEGGKQITPSEYAAWLSGTVQVGGQVTGEIIPGGLLIKFHYFGDK